MQYEVLVRDRKIKYHIQEDLDRFFMMLYTIGTPRDYALFSFMVYFALRASEVGLIGLDHLDLKGHRIWITRFKRGHLRRVSPTPNRPAVKAAASLSQFSWPERTLCVVSVALEAANLAQTN